jgi:hypothetical protein
VRETRIRAAFGTALFLVVAPGVVAGLVPSAGSAVLDRVRRLRAHRSRLAAATAALNGLA